MTFKRFNYEKEAEKPKFNWKEKSKVRTVLEKAHMHEKEKNEGE